MVSTRNLSFVHVSILSPQITSFFFFPGGLYSYPTEPPGLPASIMSQFTFRLLVAYPVIFCLYTRFKMVMAQKYHLHTNLNLSVPCVSFRHGVILSRSQYSAGLRAGRSGVRILAGAENFSPHHRVQNDSGVHPASYPMDNRGYFPGGNAAWA
jgi:hypothetical protein